MNFLLTVVRWTMDDVPFSAASNIILCVELTLKYQLEIEHLN